MARKVFFSFHFDRDAWRVAQVRNSNVVRHNYAQPPFLDWADWQSVAKSGDAAIKKWIDDQLHGSSVTIVLIGNETYTRKWVLYEIEKSYLEKKGLLGIYIHGIKDKNQITDPKGHNPFSLVLDENDYPLSFKVSTYDWIYQEGRMNIGKWIEEAIEKI